MGRQVAHLFGGPNDGAELVVSDPPPAILRTASPFATVAIVEREPNPAIDNSGVAPNVYRLAGPHGGQRGRWRYEYDVPGKAAT